jgi:hypothetical protein
MYTAQEWRCSVAEGALDKFFQIEREKYGKANYYFKPDKFSSKVRAFYVRPFCPNYILDFTTTIYPNTFFAGKKGDNTQSCLETEYHENVHKWDRWHEGFKFVLKYAWPHWMGLPFLLAAIALGGLWSCVAFAGFIVLLHIGLVILALSARANADGLPAFGFQIVFYVLVGLGLLGLLAINIWFAWWWALLWLDAAIFFSPWPFKPVWRRNYEIRGYTMSLYRIWLKYKANFDSEKFKEAINKYVEIFAGPGYLFMETDRNWVRQEFLFQVARIQFSEIAFLERWVWKSDITKSLRAEAEPFRMAKSFIEREGFGG